MQAQGEVSDVEFLKFVLGNIIAYPDELVVDRTTDEMGVLMIIKVNPEDMGKIIGREGNTAKAIRTLMRVVGMKKNARINVKILEPGIRDSF